LHAESAKSVDRTAKGGRDMKNVLWIPIGIVAGIASGAVFGVDYAIAGSVIGLSARAGIWIGLRVRAGRRSPRQSR
jgi:hypothetical protein